MERIEFCNSNSTESVQFHMKNPALANELSNGRYFLNSHIETFESLFYSKLTFLLQ